MKIKTLLSIRMLKMNMNKLKKPQIKQSSNNKKNLKDSKNNLCRKKNRE